MDMKYSINQYPKNKEIQDSKFSKSQKEIRDNQDVIDSKDKKVCKSCNKEQSINEFWYKDKKTGRRSNKCRDCCLRDAGVVEIGRVRFAKKILEKGFRRCTLCKNIKLLSDFGSNKSKFNGVDNICIVCDTNRARQYYKEQRDNITDFYVKQYAKWNGYKEVDDELIKELRTKIKESRKSKYHVDGIGFNTIRDFARYIESNYGISVVATEKRISKGCTEEECKMTRNELREYRKRK